MIWVRSYGGHRRHNPKWGSMRSYYTECGVEFEVSSRDTPTTLALPECANCSKIVAARQGRNRGPLR